MIFCEAIPFFFFFKFTVLKLVSSQNCSFACCTGVDTVFSLCEIASCCKAVYTDSPPCSRHRKFYKLHKTVGLILNINVNNSLKLNYFTREFRIYFVQEKYEERKDSFSLLVHCIANSRTKLICVLGFSRNLLFLV